MADTPRSKADLKLLYADNPNGGISEQDGRDFIESMHLACGGLNLDSPAATTISIAGTYYKGAGTTIARSVLRKFTHANNRLTYTGIPDVHGLINCSAIVSIAGNNKVAGLQLAKNGIVDAGTYVQREMQSPTDRGVVGVHGDFALSTNDYVEMWITNETDTTAVTLQHIYMSIMGMFV